MNEPVYPVYLVLNPYAVSFYYHGLPFDDNEKKKDDKKEDHYSHSHICILHLPLSLNLAAKDNLSSRLSSFYSGTYKISEKYKNRTVKSLAEESSSEEDKKLYLKIMKTYESYDIRRWLFSLKGKLHHIYEDRTSEI